MSNLNCTLRFNASGGRYGSGDEYEANIYSRTYTEGSDPFEPFASIVKDESFRLENEWRLVLHPVDAERTRNYTYVSGKPRLFSELFGSDFGLADSIKRIVCSPHGRSLDKARVIASLRQLSVIPESSKSTYMAQS